jgi:xanthine dehydrogenase molybdenum-binding subunit
MGQGFHAALTLGVAESLGVRPENVFINQTDTATCPWDVGTHASRGAFTSCHAARLAAEKLRARIFTLAAEVLPDQLRKQLRKQQQRDPDVALPEVDLEALARPDNLELSDGVLRFRDGPTEAWATLDLGRFLRAIHFREGGQMLTAEAFYEPPTELPDWQEGKGNLSACYAYGAQGVEVEVDERTGEVRILRMVAVHDVGRILNQQTLRGQIYGALAQGLGYALYEEQLSEQGRILNPSFTDYKIATAHEMAFPVEVAFVETDDPRGPFGAKGVGEPGMVPTAPAIASAVHDAVGIRLRHLPMTPDKVLRALRER